MDGMQIVLISHFYIRKMVGFRLRRFGLSREFPDFQFHKLIKPPTNLKSFPDFQFQKINKTTEKQRIVKIPEPRCGCTVHRSREELEDAHRSSRSSSLADPRRSRKPWQMWQMSLLQQSGDGWRRCGIPRSSAS